MATSNLIIGLGHRKRVGKDAFAGFLADALHKKGYVCRKLSFAEHLKEFAHKLFRQYGLLNSWMYDLHPELREVILPKLGKTPRQIWIEFGNAMRAIHPDIWVNFVRKQILELTEWYKLEPESKFVFILTDVRFPNEAEAIKYRGGRLFKISRASAPVATDEAEHALDGYTDWDLEIDCDDLDQLRRAAEYALHFL